MENYFNYFTEIEEHFQKARGTGTFRLSTLDWALIESWKETNVPLDAVLRGIDRAFEKWHARSRRGRMVNSLAYCAQQVTAAAQEEAPRPARAPAAPPFSQQELAAALDRCAAAVRGHFPDLARSLDDLREAAESGVAWDLEQVERRLTVLEDKMYSALVTSASEERLLAARRELDLQLQPYRRNLSASEISLLETGDATEPRALASGCPRRGRLPGPSGHPLANARGSVASTVAASFHA
ncbi:MAG: hypothetical protein NTZ98_02535 [Acidobacteria bacterium]|nr:hypothetical protein [Acidobacteriota bacterium]